LTYNFGGHYQSCRGEKDKFRGFRILAVRPTEASWFEKSTFFHFRPEKRGFELMRAALPHLKLLTLKADQLSQLGKYLTSEEKYFLSVRLTFKKEDWCGAAPPSLNTNSNVPAVKQIVELEEITSSPLKETVELISKDLITKGYSEMKSPTCINKRTKFFCGISLKEDRRLMGVEILTRFKRFDEAHSPKKARYFNCSVLFFKQTVLAGAEIFRSNLSTFGENPGVLGAK